MLHGSFALYHEVIKQGLEICKCLDIKYQGKIQKNFFSEFQDTGTGMRRGSNKKAAPCDQYFCFRSHMVKSVVLAYLSQRGPTYPAGHSSHINPRLWSKWHVGLKLYCWYCVRRGTRKKQKEKMVSSIALFPLQRSLIWKTVPRKSDSGLGHRA